MPKLNISGITNEEAYQRRSRDLNGMSLADGEVEIVIPSIKGKTLKYKLKDALTHLVLFMKDGKDLIGAKEIQFSKELIAYERSRA